jgi:hypothetical protein
MSNQHAPGTSRVARFARGRRFDDNPLRRRSDRAETVILAGLLVALLVGGPLAMRAGGGFAHGLAWQAQRSQLARERYVTAVTTRAVPPVGANRDLGMTSYSVPARWTAPDGQVTIGDIIVPLGAPAGTRERVWVTLNGELGVPPLQGFQIAGLTMMGQMGALVALVLVLAMAKGLVRHEMDRRRFAAWEEDWRSINPRRQHKLCAKRGGDGAPTSRRGSRPPSWIATAPRPGRSVASRS